MITLVSSPKQHLLKDMQHSVFEKDFRREGKNEFSTSANFSSK
jgi:hypothetical protein